MNGRLTLAVVVSTVFAATAGLALVSVGGHAGPGIACRVLANDSVPFIASNAQGCTLRPYDRLLDRPAGSVGASAAGDSVSVRVERNGIIRGDDVRRVETAAGQAGWELLSTLLVTGVMVGTGLLLLSRTPARAAVPLLLFFGAGSTMLVAATASAYCSWCFLPELLAAGAMPAILVHLAVTFPRERALVRRRPELLYGVYALNAVLVLLAFANFTRAPAVWSTIDRLLLALTAIAWIGVATCCVLAVRESESVRERTRARVLLFGVAAVPTALVATAIAWGDAFPGGQLSLIRATAWFLPLPIGYAIVQYRLFDLSHSRSGPIAYLAFVSLSAASVWGLWMAGAALFDLPLPLGSGAQIYALFFMGFLLTDAPRLGLWRFLNGLMSSWVSSVRGLSTRYAEQWSELVVPRDCARHLCETIDAGLRPAGVSAFLQADDGWQIAHACGDDAALAPALARAALEACPDGDVVYLEEKVIDETAAEIALREAGVEVVCCLRSPKGMLGVALLTASTRGRPYTSYHLEFLETVSRHAALAIHNANLAQDLVAAERLATEGRIGAGLLHDIGKKLGTVLRLADRLPRRRPEAVEADATTIHELTEQALGAIRGLLGRARASAERLPPADGTAPLDAVVEGALLTIGERRGRVSVELEGGLPPVRRARDRLTRVFVNLIDNALRASPDGPVHVTARTDAGVVALEVSDDGCGMSPTVVERAFDPFFTTRTNGEGSGLGLSTSRDLVEELGGSMAIDSVEGRGTKVAVRIPIGRC